VIQIAHELFQHENSQVVELIAQRGCATSFLGDFEDSTGQSLEQPSLTSELTLL